jgi:hypothetical protein
MLFAAALLAFLVKKYKYRHLPNKAGSCPSIGCCMQSTQQPSHSSKATRRSLFAWERQPREAQVYPDLLLLYCCFTAAFAAAFAAALLLLY